VHAVHEMQPIVTDVRGVCLSVCPSVCLSCGSTQLNCAKKAERIKMLIGSEHSQGPTVYCVTWGS